VPHPSICGLKARATLAWGNAAAEKRGRQSQRVTRKMKKNENSRRKKSSGYF
jgi:hypothetical protein